MSRITTALVLGASLLAASNLSFASHSRRCCHHQRYDTCCAPAPACAAAPACSAPAPATTTPYQDVAPPPASDVPAPAPAPSAQNDRQTYRSFSFDPGQGTSPNASTDTVYSGPVYTAPRARSSGMRFSAERKFMGDFGHPR